MNKHCTQCGKRHTFTPSLKERGLTWKTAKAVFVDAKGGRCTDCYLAHRAAEDLALMRRIAK
jgi:hypothetical protein